MLQHLARLLRPQRNVEHWGSTYNFKPALVAKVWGNGQQLVMLFPINERPRYWVVRVDSKCGDLHELLGDICDAIDEQFGTPSEDDLGVGDERPYFPMYDDQGCSWHFVTQSEK